MTGEELFDRYGADVLGPWREQPAGVQAAWAQIAADVTAAMQTGQRQEQAMLKCDACKVEAGPFGSYEEWEDGARRLGWAVGEEHVLCALCSGGSPR